MGKVFGIITVFLVLILCSFGFALSITSPANGFDTNNTNFNFVISSTLGDSNYLCFNKDSNCQSNSVSITPNPQTVSYSSSGLSLSQGSNTIFVCEHDGNTQTTIDWACSSITINYDSNGPTITIDSGVSDGNYYDTNQITVTTSVTDTHHTIATKTYKINSRDKVALTSPIQMDFNEGSNTLTIDANDSFGNSSSKTITVYIDTLSPNIVDLDINYGTTYSKNTNPKIIFELNKGESYFQSMLLSCNNTDWNTYSFSNNYSGFNMTTGAGCDTNTGDRNIFAKVIDKVGRTSDYAKAIYKFDNLVPSTPTNLGISNGDRQVTLTWTAAAADTGGSGNAGYYIYKGGIKIATVGSVLTYTATGLTNNVQYYFQISTYDVAGNESALTVSESAVPQQQDLGYEITVKKSGTAVSYAKPNDELTIACATDEDVDDLRIKYKYDNGSVSNLTDAIDNTDTLSETIDVDGDYDQVKFWCSWTYSNSSYLSSEKTIILDSENPTVTWISSGNSLTGTETISFTATDDKSIGTIELYIGTEKLTWTKSSNTYSYDLNTLKYANGSYTLKAKAFDAAGNVTEITKAITITNQLTAEQEREEAISSAQQKKIVVEDLIAYYDTEGLLFSEDLIIMKADADALLEEAIASSSTTDAVTKANAAKAKYDEINDGATVISISSDSTLPNGTLQEALALLGISGERADQIAEITAGANVVRTVSIVKTGDTYQAKVELRFTNDTNETMLKLIEIIPKEFVNSALKIISNYDFNIIQADPIIEFILPVQQGAQAVINYSIGNLTEEEANNIRDGNVVAKFSAPIVTKADDSVLMGPGIDFISIIAILIIIIIVVALGVGALAMMNTKGNALGKGNSLGFSSKVGKSEDKPSTPSKWKYK